MTSGGPPRRAGGYDEFAWLYDREWGGISLSFMPVLDRLVLDELPTGSRILDLACGTGQLAERLVARGFEVTGLDSSDGMLALARARVPGATFIHADARSFRLPARHDAVISVFDSLNHVMSIAELQTVFERVHAVLVPGGRFVFDLNTEAAAAAGSTNSFVGEDHVAVVRTAYDAESRTLRFEAVTFRPRNDCWERADIVLSQRCHTEEEVRRALDSAGFIDLVVVSSEALGRRPGRLFYSARVP